ncbi:MAG: hypothetical protein QXE31_00435 [Candidatus Woesearchaeota archaeon]
MQSRLQELLEEYILEYKIRFYYLYVEDVNPFVKGKKIPSEFDEFNPQKILDHGRHSLAVLLSDGNVLKISQLPPKKITYFDAPIIDNGTIQGIPFLIQPFYPLVNDSFEILSQFDYYIRPDAILCDPIVSNLAFTEPILELKKEDIGKKVFLIDYDAVVRLL